MLRFVNIAAIATAAAAAVACAPTFDQEDADELSEAASEDVTDLLRVGETQSAAAENLGTEEISDEMCWDTIGDCELCAGYAGTVESGTFEVGVTSTPCGATWQALVRTRTYTVDASELDGTWTRQSGTTYLVEISGERSVTYEVTGGREGDRTYDASWALDDLSVVASDDALDSYELDLSYTGFAGHDSHLEMSGDADAGSGTLTVDGTLVCDVTRSGDVVTIDCP